ncbi:MAG: hypothetical protein WB524_06345 [Acidobacteriaceae bacterium]
MLDTSKALFAAVIGAVIGVVGIFVSQLLLMRFNVLTERKKLTLEMHEEWHGKDMFHIRELVHQYMAHPANWNVKFPDRDWYDLEALDAMRAKNVRDMHPAKDMPDEEREGFYRIGLFYHRLYTLMTNGCLQKSLLPDLFGEEFTFYYVVHFARLELTSTGWESSKSIESLHRWFKTKSRRRCKAWTRTMQHRRQEYERLYKEWLHQAHSK